VKRFIPGQDRSQSTLFPEIYSQWALNVCSPRRRVVPATIRQFYSSFIFTAVIGGLERKPSNPDLALIKLIAKAHLLKSELEDGTVDSIKAFATKHNIDHGDAKNLIPLSYLAPSIVEDILSGHQPEDLTARKLKYLSSLPQIGLISVSSWVLTSINQKSKRSRILPGETNGQNRLYWP